MQVCGFLFPLHMCDKHVSMLNACVLWSCLLQVRLTFKPDLQQLWIASATSTQKSECHSTTVCQHRHNGLPTQICAPPCPRSSARAAAAAVDCMHCSTVLVNFASQQRLVSLPLQHLLTAACMRAPRSPPVQSLMRL